MPKAILEFNLPEDVYEHCQAVHAHDAWQALYEIDSRLRQLLKHGSPTKEMAALAEEVRREIAEAQRHLP